MRPALLGMCALLMWGCTHLRAVLVNDKGEYLTCANQSAGIIGSAVAHSRFDDCVADAKQKGYRIVSEQK